MADWNLGSVAETVLDLVPDVPTSISGIRLLELADRQREHVQDYTGISIGSNAIGIRFQDAITNFTIAKTTGLMMLQGSDASEVKLGEFTVKKGANSNLDVMSKNAEMMAQRDLKSIGRKAQSFKANG